MSRKIKILVAVLTAVVLLTAGTTAIVLAQDNAPPAQVEAGVKGLLARIAEKLGIPEQQLADAVKEARQDIRDEAIARKIDDILAKAVEKGTIIQQESDAIKAWWNGRPEAMDKLLSVPSLPGFRDLVMRGDTPVDFKTLETGGIRNFKQELFQGIVLPDITRILQGAVDRGVITQAEADNITAWWSGRPEAVNKLFQGVAFNPMPFQRIPCLPAR